MDDLKILVVDDHDGVRSVLSQILAVEPEVAEIREASDGAQAIRACETFAPDLVLLDLKMPKVDGERAATEIRATHPGVCIIAFSAQLQSKPSWADAFFPKVSIPDPRALIRIAARPRTGPATVDLSGIADVSSP